MPRFSNKVFKKRGPVGKRKAVDSASDSNDVQNGKKQKIKTGTTSTVRLTTVEAVGEWKSQEYKLFLAAPKKNTIYNTLNFLAMEIVQLLVQWLD
ncbi:hypothetical protein J6590_026833 [Homalodisca vitripennis]|nr:hypothetical protein J6590_026833 [Homalodisca vitripennis]